MLPRITLRPIGIVVIVVFTALLLGSCKDHTAPPDEQVESVAPVAGDGQEGTVGNALAQELVARATDDRGRPVDGAAVEWTVTSGGGSVAAGAAVTDEDGEARATWTLGTVAGAQTVSVTIGDAAPATFTAVALPGPAESLEIVPPAVALDAIDATQALEAVGTDAFGNTITGRAAAWSSLDEGVAVVDAAGVVRAVANGTTRVQAAMDGATAEADVVVAQVPTSVEIDPPAPVLTALGEVVQLTAAAVDGNGHAVAGLAFEWTSTDAGVVTVDATGLVTAVANGTAQVVAAVVGGTLSGTADVTVQQAAASVQVTPGMALLTALGETVQLVAVAFDDNGQPLNGVTFTWTSSDEAVVTVDAAGLVTAVANGVASITATSGAASDTATITVALTQGPSAQPDTYTIIAPAMLTIAAPGVLANDNLGDPAGTVARYGGGDLPGDAGFFPAGAQITIGAGGSLQVNADGSFSFTPPTGLSGPFTFEYRLTNSEGSSDGTVTIEVQEPPAAVADAYQTPVDVPLSIAAAGLLGNDDPGFPAATIASFGGGSLGGAVTDNAAGTTVTFGTGSLQVNADGSFDFTPDAGFSGTFTFDYRLANVAGTSDATVTITVEQPPDAVDDADTTDVGTSLTVAAPGLLANDDLGAPAATLTSFGGGDLGGAVTDNAAGTSVPLAGGTLTVNADGSITLANPTAGGVFTFLYRLTNAAGTDDATVTITVNQPPAANDDAPPSATSAPGEAFHTPLNTPLTGPAGNTPHLLDNDVAGHPAATIASFGGGSLGGAVTDNAAGSNAAGTGGSITVNADGTFSFTPATDFTGTFTFFYRLTSAAGSDDAQVTIAAGVRPAAAADDYQAATSDAVLPNVPINTSTATPYSVLGNDAGDLVTAVLDGTPVNGQVTLNADGTFTLTPDAGFRSGDVTFEYHVQNGFGPSATVTVTVAVGAVGIWFIDNAQGTNGDGRQATPFNCLVGTGCFSAAAADAASETIFLHTGSGAYTGGLTLLPGQRVIGQGATASLAAAGALILPAHSSLPATGGTRPVLTTTAASTNAVNLAQNNALRGFDIGNTTGAGISGSSLGTLVASEMDITGTGQVLNLTGPGTLATAFGTLSTTSTGAGVPGIQINGTAGSLTAATTSISGTGGTALELDANSAALLFGVLTLSPAAGQRGLHATVNTGTISSTDGTVTASNAVAVQVAGPSAALPTPIDLTLTAVNADGGVAGIALGHTSGPGFAVTGSGTAGSGGTIENQQGGGVHLSDAQNVSLSRMLIQNTGRSGIAGTGVVNFALTNSTISGTGLQADDANIDFFANLVAPGTEHNLSGTVTITGNTLSSPHAHNIDIFNYSGTISQAIISDNTLTNNSSGHGIRLIAFGGAANVAQVTKATIDNNQITGSMSGVGLQVQCGQVNAAGPATVCGTAGSGTDVIAITNNVISGASAAAPIGTDGLVALVNGAGQGNFTISGNEISHTTGEAISHSAFGNANVTSTITGNTIIANNGFGSPGISVGTSLTSGFATNAPVLNTTISNNNVSQTDGNGILVVALDGSATLNVKIQDNTVAAPLGAFRPGIRVGSGDSSSTNETVCLNISGNTSAGSGVPTPVQGIGLRKQGTVQGTNFFGLHGVGTANPTNTDVVNHIEAQNPAGNGAFIINGDNFGQCNLP